MSLKGMQLEGFYEPQRGVVGRYLLSLLGRGVPLVGFGDTQTGVFGWFWSTQYSHFVAYEYVFMMKTVTPSTLN